MVQVWHRAAQSADLCRSCRRTACRLCARVTGLTSGRVSPALPYQRSCCDRAIRAKCTSYHYLAAGEIYFPQQVTEAPNVRSLRSGPVRRGTVWTTDAPYRETASSLRAMRKGVLAVEMQAASLFAFWQLVACL